MVTKVAEQVLITPAREAEAVTLKLPAKENSDGSYSVTFTAAQLAEHALVDYYVETTGVGYQRLEPTRERRAKEVAAHIARCVDFGEPLYLGELTANARIAPEDAEYKDARGQLHITLPTTERTVCVIDGGTRLSGIRVALADESMSADTPIDVRLFVGRTMMHEVALFVLINSRQKKVRSDLAVRLIQRYMDKTDINPAEAHMLTIAAPDRESKRYDAARIASSLGSIEGSPWRNRIQMPNELESRPVKLQAIVSSVRPLLLDTKLQEIVAALGKDKKLTVEGKRVTSERFTYQVLVNFWKAVAVVNKMADAEPSTAVLWGGIGAAAIHKALPQILVPILQSDKPDLTQKRFEEMLRKSAVSNYAFWFRQAGEADYAWPKEKGEAVSYVGQANTARLADRLAAEWKAAIGIKDTQAVA